MKKLILIGCALVVVVVAAIVFFGISNLGPIITQAVNTYGPKITQTDVQLGDAGVSLFSGEVKLEDFLLGNPKGFKAPQAMKVGSVYVDLDEKSLTGNPIVIDKIEVAAPEITYERAGRDDNFNALLRNVKKKSSSGQSGAGKQTGKDADAGGGKKLLIRSLIIKDGRVNLTAKVLAGQTITAELPYIELKDIGGQKEGVTPAKAFNLILAELYKQIQSPDVTGALSKGLEELGVTVKGVSLKGIDDQSKQKVEEVKDRVKGLLGN